MADVRSEEWKIEDILQFAGGMNYGEVVITIHDSQIVQVEKRERKRFKAQKRLPAQS
ncbi:MAG: YezD family protein [Candidatus Omnitrophica bacterium]|nr:YezD family protein [Candidatus Omnitrophota bacterium]